MWLFGNHQANEKQFLRLANLEDLNGEVHGYLLEHRPSCQTSRSSFPTFTFFIDPSVRVNALDLLIASVSSPFTTNPLLSSSSLADYYI
jgi:hypothetical protein